MKLFISSFVSLLFIVSASVVTKASASAENKILLITNADTVVVSVSAFQKDSTGKFTASIKNKERKKKFLCAVSAFPFPFGFMGAHRVMLGTKPWVPIVYAATFGGCFGIIPLIDFFVIVFSKDIEQYENNPRIFMWVK